MNWTPMPTGAVLSQVKLALVIPLETRILGKEALSRLPNSFAQMRR